jgi:hypothetical protein
MLDDDGIDPGIDLGGARDGLVQQFAGTDLFLAHEVGKADGVVLSIFRECHLSPAMPLVISISMPAAANCLAAMAQTLAFQNQPSTS